MSFSAALLDFAIMVIHSIGYVGIGLLLGVAMIGIPIPSEAVLVLAGSAARSGSLQFGIVLVIGILMQTLGCAVAFAVGSYGGAPIIKKYGKYVLISEADYKKTQAWFVKNGSRAIVLSLLTPVIRAFIGIVAGANKMDFKRFMLQCLLGSSLWTSVWLGVGLILGESWRQYYAYMHYVDYVVVLALIVFVGRFLWKRYSVLSSSQKGKRTS